MRTSAIYTLDSDNKVLYQSSFSVSNRETILVTKDMQNLSCTFFFLGASFINCSPSILACTCGIADTGTGKGSTSNRETTTMISGRFAKSLLPEGFP